MFIIESGGIHMKILFQTKANKVELVDKEKLIFNIDGKFMMDARYHHPLVIGILSLWLHCTCT